MFVEKRGVATSWTQMSTFTFPLESSADALSPTCPVLARRKSCPSNHPHDNKTESHSTPDSSLTSLGWLQNLKVLDMFSPEVRVMFLPPSPCSEDGCSWETVSSSPTSPEDKHHSCSGDTYPLSPVLSKCVVQSAQFKLAPKQYRNDPTKPPYSNTSLIYLAIQHSRSGKSTLHDICRWIKTNFKFYKDAEPGWQTIIRENLSLNGLFVKVSRSNGESSKGCCWTVHPHYRDLLSQNSNDRTTVDQLAKGGRKLKRAYSYGGNRRQSGGARKRVKSENQLPVDPCGLPGDLDWISLLSSQRVSCVSCPSQACRPVYGSPILGPPDLGHVGDPMTCSPLVVPATIASPSTPVIADTGKVKQQDEEDVFNHDSPPSSPHLLSWADSRPESPCLHPWAESKETTLRNLGRQSRQMPSVLPSRPLNGVWSPEASYSSSCSSTASSFSYRHKLRRGESQIY